MQFSQQCQERCFLGQCPGIHWSALGGESAFVADANGMCVVIFAMCAHLFQGSPAVYFSVAGDVEMVTNVTESSVADVIQTAGFEIQAPPLWGGGAVDNEECNGSHRLMRRHLGRMHPLRRWLG